MPFTCIRSEIKEVQLESIKIEVLGFLFPAFPLGCFSIGGQPFSQFVYQTTKQIFVHICKIYIIYHPSL